MSTHKIVWSRGSRVVTFPNVKISGIYNESGKDEPLVIGINYLGKSNGNKGAMLDSIMPDIIDALKRGGFTVESPTQDDDETAQRIAEDDGNTYKIIRRYEKGKSRIIRKGLTLHEARMHCNDPNTCSRTGYSPAAKRRTNKYGYWADCYEKE